MLFNITRVCNERITMFIKYFECKRKLDNYQSRSGITVGFIVGINHFIKSETMKHP